LKVVQLLPELNEGGVERGVVELNREFVARGLDSIVISAGGVLEAQIIADGGRHFKLDVASKNPLTAPLRVWQLRRLLRRLAPDILHARSRVPAWLTVLANRTLKLPFVTTVHGFNSVNAYSRIMTRGERVICVSTAIKDYVKQHYGVPEEKLTVIPRGIDLETFHPEHIDQGFVNQFVERYDLAGKFVVTSVGRITQLKDYETFIDALVLAKKRIPQLVGLIVGGVRKDKQDYYLRLQQQVEAAHAGDFIHFAGSQAKVTEIYSLSDVVVSSSKKPESFGRSAAEALAMNVPVVATNHGGILDVVIPGTTGQLFSPGDVDALTEAILSCRTLDTSGMRNFVSERFSLAHMVESTLAVYRSLARNA
jgi:glycosyltransferase involved in cell wall biosynthesis